MAFSDLLRDVWLDLIARLARSVLTAAGTFIGIAVLVSTVGLSASANAKILGRFDALAATEVMVRAAKTQGADDPSASQTEVGSIPFDAPSRLSRIDGVVTSTTYTLIDEISVQGTPVNDPTAILPDVDVVAASPELAQTVRAQVSGRVFDHLHDARADPVALVGIEAARQLNVLNVGRGPTVFVGDQPLTVIGIISAIERKPELANAVVVSNGWARARLQLTAPAEVLVETRVGAAQVVGTQVALALNVSSPESLSVSVPPAPTFTRDQVSADTRGLFLVLAAISLVIGGLSIANATLVSVMERVPELGLRRALGARRRSVVGLVLVESATLGLVGGVAGSSVGVIGTAAVSSLQGWPPVLPPAIVFMAPTLGAFIGVVAGLYPALRAGRIEPIWALRTA